MNKVRIAKFTLSLLMPVVVGACGGGSSNPPVENAGFVIGGTVAGLVNDKQVVLQNNGDEELRVVQNGNFAFTKTVVSGGDYSVTVKVQPDGLNCVVDAGSGKATANIGNIKVQCMPVAQVTQLIGDWNAIRCTGLVNIPGRRVIRIRMQENALRILSSFVPTEKSCDEPLPPLYPGFYELPLTTVRSAFIHEGIPIFRLSTDYKDQGVSQQAFWLLDQQKTLCRMVDDLAKTDEAVADEIMTRSPSTAECFVRAE